MSNPIVGKTPQRQDTLLRNSQVSQTGNFRRVVSGVIDCNVLRSNRLSSTGEISAADFAPSGLVGAQALTRYVGGTESGPPVTGTFHTGDYVITLDGHFWICTSGGSPGTWNQGGGGDFLPLAGGVMQGTIDMNTNNPITNVSYLSVSGVSGASETSRYVGATNSGAPVSGTFQTGDYVIARDGGLFICTTGGSPGTWTTSGIGLYLPLLGGTMTGTIDMNMHPITNASYLGMSGLPGATAATRYVGGTNSGHPMSGLFTVGDYVIARDGNLWICISGGSPGTWTTPGGGIFLPLAGGTMSGSIDMNNNNALMNAEYLSISGVTGANLASRYVGATSTTAPTSGMFNQGDYVIALNGNLWICTSGGTPGTWTTPGGGVFLPLAGGTMSGSIDMNTSNAVTNAQYLSVSGVTGANLASRYVGGVASVAPTSGTFSVGDYVIAQNGNVFICTTGGTPGIWTVPGGGVYLPLAGGTMSGSIDMNTNNAITNAQYLSVSGVTGATVASRYVGGVASVAPTSGTFSTGDYVIAQNGNLYICTSGGTPGIWASAGVGVYLPLAGGTMSGDINMNNTNAVTNAQYLSVSGVTGATVASRYVGGVASVAPTTGTFSTGDYVIAQNGNIFICTSGGTSGTWTSPGTGVYLPLAGGTMAGTINMNNTNPVSNASFISVSGLTGATQASRYVGATATVAPTTGTFSTGDYIIAQSGNMYICTSGGTPGTWTVAGTGAFLPLAGGTMSGSINMNNTNSVTNVSSLAIFGLTGATAGTRYVGATASVAPVSGTFQIGDFIITRNGGILVCTTGGSPGTWTNPNGGVYLPLAGGTMAGTIVMNGNEITGVSDLAVSGVTGANLASRYVGGVASVAPTTGTFSTGDYVIAQNGNIYICTSGGTPGTWTVPGTGVYLPLAGGTMAGAINMNTNNITNGGTITGTTINATTQFQLNGAQILSSFEASSLSVGLNSLSGTVSGLANTAAGSRALGVVSSGNANTGVGYAALGGVTTSSGSTAVGYNALLTLSTTGNMTALGYNALTANTTGTSNVAVGYSALASNTGFGNNFNIAVGSNAMATTTAVISCVGVGYGALNVNTAVGSTAIGYAALILNTTASGVTAVGYNALATNSTGISNTAVGYNALAANSTAAASVAIGYNAMLVNTGAQNTSVGAFSMVANTTGTLNVAIGYNALASNTISGSNTAVGYNALAVADANSNTGIGYNAFRLLTTGTNNVGVGYNVMSSVVTGSGNSAIGFGALAAATGDNNVAMGYNALTLNSTGTLNVAFGYNALSSITTNNNCTAVGYQTLAANTASNCTAVGYGAMLANTSGTESTAVGYMALATITTGTGCTAMGHNSLTLNTGNNNTALGAYSLAANVAGPAQVAIGYNAMAAYTGATGLNTAIGYRVMQTMTTGDSNVSLGYMAMASSNGSANVAVGFNTLLAGDSANVAVGYVALTAATGSTNTAIGHKALQTITTGTGNCALGYLADVSTNNLNNCIILGASATATASGQLVIHGAGSGTATLVGGTVVVSNTAVTATSIILLTATDIHAGTPGALYVSARTAGTSFTVTSQAGAGDVSTFNYVMFEP
jgi:hypothetical protein